MSRVILNLFCSSTAIYCGNIFKRKMILDVILIYSSSIIRLPFELFLDSNKSLKLCIKEENRRLSIRLKDNGMSL